MDAMQIELPDAEVVFKLPESGQELRTTLVKWREGVLQFSDAAPKENNIEAWQAWWDKVLPWVSETYKVSLTRHRFNQIDQAVEKLMQAQEKDFFDGLGSVSGMVLTPGPSPKDRCGGCSSSSPNS
jgi:hypothetical protein